MPVKLLDEDLVRLRGERFDKWSGTTKHGVVQLLFWGDAVDLIDPAQAEDPAVRDVEVLWWNYWDAPHGSWQTATIRKRKKNHRYVPLKLRDEPLLETTFLDVQQGDATVICLPDRRLLIVDAGEAKFLARYLAASFPGRGAADPLIIDALVITHGDADHFSGLVELANAPAHREPRKRIHARVLRYLHNGLVKGPDSLPELQRLGATVKQGRTTYATDLYDDPRDAPNPNTKFTAWFEAWETLSEGVDARPPTPTGETLPVIRRVAAGDDAAFDAFRPAIDLRVLGPLPEAIDGAPSLRYFRNPRGSNSASHTINGHSVVLQMHYGNVRFLLGGDLNIESQHRLREHVDADPTADLRSEILKVPHHGSHEFDPDFFTHVAPVVSVVSSGDENVAKEYVHPRASLLAALGRASRGAEPLVFSTELAAFFAYRKFIVPERHRKEDDELVELPKSEQKPGFHAFERIVWGAVRVRTDGRRVLAAVESASSVIKEAYAFSVAPDGTITPEPWSLI